MSDSPRHALVGAAILFTVALFLFGSALVRAVGIEPVRPLEDAGFTDAAAADDAASAPLSTEALMLAVDNDPFQPARERPAERYRLPGDAVPEPEPLPEVPAPLPIFLLHGTIVDPVPSRSVALIQYGEEGTPTLLPVGGSLGGYRLSEVTPEAATVTNGEREIWLRVPGPLQTVAAEPDPRRGRDNDRRRGSDRDGDASVAEQRRQQMMMLMQQFEQARQSGAPPQVLDAMRQALERAARQAGGDTRFMTYEVAPARPSAPARRVVPDTMRTDAPRASDIR